VVVWLPEPRVLYAGDIAFAGGQPFLAEGSVVGYPKALQRIRALEPEVLVPGHGPGVARAWSPAAPRYHVGDRRSRWWCVVGQGDAEWLY
jgi:cyclase